MDLYIHTYIYIYIYKELNYINEILYIRNFKVIEKFLLSLHHLTYLEITQKLF